MPVAFLNYYWHSFVLILKNCLHLLRHAKFCWGAGDPALRPLGWKEAPVIRGLQSSWSCWSKFMDHELAQSHSTEKNSTQRKLQTRPKLVGVKRARKYRATREATASSSRSWQQCAVRMNRQWQFEERDQIFWSFEEEQRDCGIKKVPEEKSGKSLLPVALSYKETHSGRCSLDDVMAVVLSDLNTIWVTHSRIECWLQLGRININTGGLRGSGSVDL